MKPIRTTTLFVLLATLLETRIVLASGAQDDTVKELMRRYEQVEEQLPRSVVFSKKETAGDETTTTTAWFNGAGDLLKVATEKNAPNVRDLTEYFGTQLEAYQPMFILTRKELRQSDGSTQVAEARQYFNEDAEAIRELRKSARFKPGESLDTVKVKNVSVDVSQKPKDERSDVEKAQARNEFFDKPLKIAGALQQAGSPVSDPLANITGDSEKYRLIQDTASPDGRYAVALGLAREKIDWEQFRDKEVEFKGGEAIYTAEEEDRRNYVVDLLHRKILGITGGDYFGTKQRYNHRECQVIWAPDSKSFVEITSDKWNYDTCRAGRIANGPKLLGTVDLGKYAEKVADSFRIGHKLRKERGSIAIGIIEVTNDGIIDLEVTGQVSGGERKGDVNFNVAEKIRLRDTAGRLTLETVNVHNAPIE